MMGVWALEDQTPATPPSSRAVGEDRHGSTGHPGVAHCQNALISPRKETRTDAAPNPVEEGLRLGDALPPGDNGRGGGVRLLVRDRQRDAHPDDQGRGSALPA